MGVGWRWVEGALLRPELGWRQKRVFPGWTGVAVGSRYWARGKAKLHG